MRVSDIPSTEFRSESGAAEKRGFRTPLRSHEGRLNILVVSCVYPPETVTSAETSAQLAEGLVREGHRVTVLAPIRTRSGKRLRSELHRSLPGEEAGGYQLLRTFSMPAPRFGLLSKFLENISFGFSSFWRAWRLKPDVIYSNTWPLFASGLIALYAMIRRIPLVVSVQDIHPESALHVKKLRAAGLLVSVLRRLDAWIALRSSALVTISDRFAEFYRSNRRVPAAKVHVVPNWMDEKSVVPGERMGPFRRRRGISEETFLAMYVGSLGVVSDWATVLSAASTLKEVPGIRFVLAGGGSQRAMCEEDARARGLENVSFVYPLKAEEFNEVQAAADLLLLPTRSGGALTSVPSKLIAYLLAARPVLAAVDPESDTQAFMQEARCGVCIPPANPEAMADAILKLRKDPESASVMGSNGRKYAEKRFSRSACVPDLIRLLESVRGKRTAEADPPAGDRSGAARPPGSGEDARRRAPAEEPDADGFRIVPMAPEHVSAAVRVHLRSFPGFFLTFLGPRFLALFYSELLRDHGHVAFVALDRSSSVSGLAVGVTRPSGFYRRLIMHRLLSFLLNSFPAAMRRPTVIPRLLRALRTPKDSKKLTGQALLMSMAVRPDVQSRGLGRRLLARFVDQLRVLGVESVCLTTDRDGNEPANQFYRRAGFSTSSVHQTPEGRWLNEYFLKL